MVFAKFFFIFLGSPGNTVDGIIFAKYLRHVFGTSFEILDMSNGQNVQFLTRNPMFTSNIGNNYSQKGTSRKSLPFYWQNIFLQPYGIVFRGL